MSWQRFRVNIDKKYKPEQRAAIGAEIVRVIQERSVNGIDINGSKFPRYTKDYAAKKGVSRGAVDLTLTGEMLANLKMISENSGSILVGYEKGDPANGKAEGNNMGSYGGSPDPSKVRRFLGISETELESILSKFDE